LQQTVSIQHNINTPLSTVWPSECDDYKAEKQKILDIGRRNGYTEEDINEIIHKQERDNWRKQQSTFNEIGRIIFSIYIEKSIFLRACRRKF
jgi:hypothetical protein